MRKLIALIALVGILASCQATPEDVVPTLVEFPTETETPPATITPSPTVPTETFTPSPTDTPSDTPTATLTLTPSDTPTVTLTPTNTRVASETPNSTQSARSTATAQFIERPQFSTFTPLPSGIIGVVRPTSTGTPEMIADVVITRQQFQEELDIILSDDARISRVVATFTPAGVDIELTALSNAAFVTGSILVPFELSVGGFNNILIIGGGTEFRMASGEEPTADYVDTALTVVVPAVQETLNNILNQRLGEGRHNLEFLEFTGQQMNINLLVPQN